MDAVELAKTMLEYGELMAAAADLEERIKAAVLELQATQTVGNVKATYSGGRTSYDYEAAARAALAQMPMPEAGLVVDAFTETTVRTDWRALALKGLQIAQEDVPAEKSAPSVRVVLL